MYNLDNLHNLNNLNNMCECFNHATVSYVVRQLLGVKDHGLGPGPVQHRGPQPGHHQDHPVLLAVPVHGGGLPDRHVRLQAPTPLPRPPAPGHGALLPQAVRQEPWQQRVRGLPPATDRDGLDEEDLRGCSGTLPSLRPGMVLPAMRDHDDSSSSLRQEVSIRFDL